MKILVIHLVRFGDVIQTLHVIDCICQAHAKCEVHMMVEKSLSFFPEHHPCVAKTVAFDAEQHGDLVGGATAWDQFSPATRALIDDINDERYDHVINYQHGIIGPQLMKYIRAHRKSGSSLNDTNHTIVLDSWTQFLFLCAKKRQHNAWNIVDYYCRIAGVATRLAHTQLALSDDEWRDAADRCQRWGFSFDDSFVCVQCGASREFRRWPEQYFLQVIRHLVEHQGKTVVLLGSDAEKALSETIVAACPSVVSIVGKTTFADLVAVISHAQFLLTNDTGTMHLGAQCHVPVLVIGLSEVSARETAPVSQGQTWYVQPILSCYPCENPDQCREHYLCRTTVGVKEITACVDSLLAQASIVPQEEFPKASCMELRLSEDAPYFVPQYPRRIESALLADEVMRVLLPTMWESVHEAHETTTAQQLHGVLSQCWQWDEKTIQQAVGQVQCSLVQMHDAVRLGLVLIDEYEHAIALHDATSRTTCCKQLEEFDQVVAQFSGVLSFFKHYYNLECRLAHAAGGTLQELLTMNAQVLTRMRAMGDYLEVRCKDIAAIGAAHSVRARKSSTEK